MGGGADLVADDLTVFFGNGGVCALLEGGIEGVQGDLPDGFECLMIQFEHVDEVAAAHLAQVNMRDEGGRDGLLRCIPEENHDAVFFFKVILDQQLAEPVGETECGDIWFWIRKGLIDLLKKLYPGAGGPVGEAAGE